MSVYVKENKDKNEKTISFRFAVPRGKDSDTGKPLYHWETLKTDSSRELNKRIRQVQSEIDHGQYVKPTKQTVKDYLTAWLKDNALPNMTPRTYEGYQFNIDKYILPALGALALSQLTAQRVQKLIGDIQAVGHNRTAQYVYNTLNKSFNVAVKIGLLARNPCDGIEPPKVQRHEMQTMSETDMHILLEYAKSTPYYALFYTDLFTGMRRSELLALRWLDVELPLCQISVNRTLHYMNYGTYKGQTIFKQPKTAKSRRMIALTPSNALILKDHREAQDRQRVALELKATTDNDLVFGQWDGKPYLPSTITHAWMKLARHTGLKGVRLHDCRHTHATILLKQGVHPKVVQERLGHATISTTLDTYSHVAPGLQAAAAIAFDKVVLPQEEAIQN